MTYTKLNSVIIYTIKNRQITSLFTTPTIAILGRIRLKISLGWVGVVMLIRQGNCCFLEINNKTICYIRYIDG